MKDVLYKYEVEYYHDVTISSKGSGLSPRVMDCSDCGLHIEIHDGHITYSKNDKTISTCVDPNGGSTCLGWPKVPICNK